MLVYRADHNIKPRTLNASQVSGLHNVKANNAFIIRIYSTKTLNLQNSVSQSPIMPVLPFEDAP